MRVCIFSSIQFLHLRAYYEVLSQYYLNKQEWLIYLTERVCTLYVRINKLLAISLTIETFPGFNNCLAFIY